MKAWSQKAYLYGAVKHIDLKSFVSREAGIQFAFKGGDSWVGLCPFHVDSAPSFFVSKQPNGVWLYHCFGCNSGGTIIDFCREKFDTVSTDDAVAMAAQKEGIKCDESLIIKMASDAKVEIDSKRHMDMAHYATSCVCRRLLLLANGDVKVTSWVAKAYRRMNALLDADEPDIEKMTEIGHEASRMTYALHEAVTIREEQHAVA